MTHDSEPAQIPREVIIVGLGTVAETHIKALESISDVAVVAGVDITPPIHQPAFRGRRIPVYPSLRDVAIFRAFAYR